MDTNNQERSGQLVIGIDATNLRGGGGITHLAELLTAAEPEKYSIAKVVVWGGELTLSKLPDRAWLEKINPTLLDGGLIHRTWWQRFNLTRAVREARCDVLFVPGGSYAGSFRPFVTMSRNLLPFEWRELRRYSGSLTFLKLLILRYVQSRSYRQADGVVFLTEYAKKAVQEVIGQIAGKTTIIPHGINARFQIQPRSQRPISEYSESRPYRLLYVSIVDHYKHQWRVVEAVHAIRKEGLPVHLELVGPANPSAMARLQAVTTRLDAERHWVHYHGAIPYELLHQLYARADLGIFASSCENMPNILLETMAAGVPVACSSRGPMPEVLGNAGLYFDPEKSGDMTKVLRKFIYSPELRSEKARASFERAMQFSWERCTNQTFSFLSGVALGHR